MNLLLLAVGFLFLGMQFENKEKDSVQVLSFLVVESIILRIYYVFNWVWILRKYLFLRVCVLLWMQYVSSYIMEKVIRLVIESWKRRKKHKQSVLAKKRKKEKKIGEKKKKSCRILGKECKICLRILGCIRLWHLMILCIGDEIWIQYWVQLWFGLTLDEIRRIIG